MRAPPEGGKAGIPVSAPTLAAMMNGYAVFAKEKSLEAGGGGAIVYYVTE
jgi:hypothetical protein